MKYMLLTVAIVATLASPLTAQTTICCCSGGSGGGSGTVTSVGLTAPDEISVAGSPVTSSGTLALTWAAAAQNTIFAGPSAGGAGTPLFRSLESADLPAIITGLTSVSSTAFVGALTGNASTASTLAANPTDCGAGEFANAIDASGNLTCDEPAGGGGSGDVVGPATATDNAVARFDGTTGELLQNSTVTISDAGVMAFPAPPTSQGGGGSNEEIWGSGATGHPGEGWNNTVLGAQAKAYKLSVAMGDTANAGGAPYNVDSTVAIGRASIAAGVYAASLGHGATAGTRATALGASTNAAGSDSIAIGNRTLCTIANVMCVGSNTSFGSQITDTYLGSGFEDASPVTGHTIHGTGGDGTNVAGTHVNIAGGTSTGTGTGGDVRMRTSPSGTSGAASNPLVDRIAVRAKGVDLTSAAAADVLDVTLPAGAMASGSLDVGVIATDGTDMQSLSCSVRWVGVNKAGTYTTAITAPDGTSSPTDAQCAKALSSGTLTLAWSIANGTNKITVQATATTSLTATKFRLYYIPTNNSEQAISFF